MQMTPPTTPEPAPVQADPGAMRRSSLETYLPKSLEKRLAFLAFSCTILICLFSIPLTLWMENSRSRAHRALEIQEKLITALNKVDEDYYPFRKELLQAKDVVQSWRPKGLAPWFSLMEGMLKRLPKAHGIRIEFIAKNQLGPDKARALYVWRDGHGAIIRQDFSEEFKGPFHRFFEAVNASKQLKVADYFWCDPFSAQENPSRKLLACALPLTRQEEGLTICDGLIGIDIPFDVLLESLSGADLGVPYQPYVLDAKQRVWNREQTEVTEAFPKENFPKSGFLISQDLKSKKEHYFIVKNLTWMKSSLISNASGYPVSFLFKVPVPAWSVQSTKVLIFSILPWLLGWAGMGILIRWGIEKIIRNFYLVRSGIKCVQSGNFHAKIPSPTTQDETAELIEAFNDMAAELELEFTHLKTDIAQQQQVQAELFLAKSLQKTLQPGPLRTIGGSLYGLTLAGQEPGADFFDHFLLPEGRTAILVGDASGRDIHATVFMMRTSQMLKSALSAMDPCDAFAQVNSMLVKTNPQMMFVTAFLAIWDPKSKSLCAINAGHNQPMIVRANGAVETLRTNSGPVLGIMRGQGYKLDKIPFQEGDLLTIFTKGLCEAQNTRLVQFGQDQISASLLQTLNQPLPICAQTLVDQVLTWQGSHERLEDMTINLFRAERSPSHVRLPASIATLETVAAMVESTAQAGGMDLPSAREIAMAVGEATTNVITHALKEDSNLFFEVFASWDGEEFLVRIEDPGPPFDPTSLPFVEMDAVSEDRPVTGLGWVLIRQSTDQVQMDRIGGTNILSLVRLKKRATSWQ